MYKYFLLVLSCWVLGMAAQAQPLADTAQKRGTITFTPVKTDTASNKAAAPAPVKGKKSKPKALAFNQPDSTHSPHRAVILSAILPGLGQMYNGKGLWWRLPLIYGGFALIIDGIIYNQKSYSNFLKESEYRAGGRIGTDPMPEYINVSDQAIYDFKDLQRRDRDLCIIILFGAWGINMIDAYVEARFIHSYTMDNNLSFKITPSLTPQPTTYAASNVNATFMPSLKFTLRF